MSDHFYALAAPGPSQSELDALDERVLDWLVAAGLILAYLPTAMGLALGKTPSLLILTPQLFISIFAYPLVGRLVALFDRFRLVGFRYIG